ncbi:MBL fold metallo-hydrolase [Micromonospora aurantiaca]|uniref:MBL fold metallo-hydrolase n=1 Tax=Micromonospora aurantiaca (nom. illeg.) TaxID=47850 RepID=A0A3M9KYH4_9ACTN|nr:MULTISPECIES: MBL fold metallo-hydrolase [Micromonospora]ADU06596.1 beta-lactamase domain-containing protein [Micromonospora sp. L5]AXH90590.1 MBL fold metallo-hydrolase [Micromonospora aurantiaca]KAB1117988.1 MBL fold metallo-hydrolase [Micromonospora aurantiaca]MBC9003144.1 MBL fold metallo-hydrolase [Micromonospora aurantiaca]MDG4756022.1 MBL fold metallo-hydrolase [Micromonospora sp. WMMD718]
MQVTKYAHSCLRLEHDGAVLVVDPGVFSDPAALDGADAVLITHEHPDHVDVAALTRALERRPVPVHGPASLAGVLGDAAEALVTVEPGQSLTVAGTPVRTYGGQHAVIHPDIPVIQNIGYLFADVVYHPGDALFVPDDVQVDTLFAPIHAPWSKFSEVLDFIRAVAPRRAYALHDGLLNDNGFGVLDRQYTAMSNTDYRRLEPGTRIDA